MKAAGDKNATLLSADYFLWDELQVEDNLSQINKPVVEKSMEKADAKTQEFIHNEIRDKIVDIGRWLGLQANQEVKVANGAVVDATWEATRKKALKVGPSHGQQLATMWRYSKQRRVNSGRAWGNLLGTERGGLHVCRDKHRVRGSGGEFGSRLGRKGR